MAEGMHMQQSCIVERSLRFSRNGSWCRQSLLKDNWVVCMWLWSVVLRLSESRAVYLHVQTEATAFTLFFADFFHV